MIARVYHIRVAIADTATGTVIHCDTRVQGEPVPIRSHTCGDIESALTDAARALREEESNAGQRTRSA